jgi:acetylornithine deacetylase
MQMPHDARQILEHLIRFETPSHLTNEAITRWLDQHLIRLGFETEWIVDTDENGIRKCNLVARRRPVAANRDGDQGGLAYFAHTDVVPADVWEGPGGPFEPTVQEGKLYGRGACDMKGSLAAMLAAIARIPIDQQRRSIWITATADEEIGFGGAKSVCSRSNLYREMCRSAARGIIGEPTRLHVMHAHKGIRGFRLVSRGREAHSSTRLGVNANLAMMPVLTEIAAIHQETETDPIWQDTRFDPPTLSWTFGICDGMTAINITPGRSRVWVSLRPMPDIDGDALVDRVRHLAASHGVEFHDYHGGGVLWVDADDPWVTTMCRLAARDSPETVSYCTDAGQFTELASLVVCGPGDIAQAHTVDEFITLDDLNSGTDFYQRVLGQVLH